MLTKKHPSAKAKIDTHSRSGLQWQQKYPKLVLREAGSVPEELHREVQAAFATLHKHGCLARDLVRVQGKDLLIPVARLLVGNPGCTYKYLSTRLFAVPWPVRGSNITYHEAEIAAACQTLLSLNSYLQLETVQAWEELVAKERANIDEVPVCIGPDFGLGIFDGPDEADIRSRSAYNVTLLNFMDPQKMPYLKEEPYFGMGKMAVSWHHDEHLVDRSAVAVYSHSCEGTVRAGHTWPRGGQDRSWAGSGPARGGAHGFVRLGLFVCVCVVCVSSLGWPQPRTCRIQLCFLAPCHPVHREDVVSWQHGCHFVPPVPPESQVPLSKAQSRLYSCSN